MEGFVTLDCLSFSKTVKTLYRSSAWIHSRMWDKEVWDKGKYRCFLLSFACRWWEILCDKGLIGQPINKSTHYHRVLWCWSFFLHCTIIQMLVRPAMQFLALYNYIGIIVLLIWKGIVLRATLCLSHNLVKLFHVICTNNLTTIQTDSQYISHHCSRLLFYLLC